MITQPATAPAFEAEHATYRPRAEQGYSIVSLGDGSLLAIAEGRDRFGAMQARANVARVLLLQGKVVESLALYDEALAEHLALLPAEHVLVYTVRIHRIRALEKARRLAEARAELSPLLVQLAAAGSEKAYLLTAGREIAARLDAAP